MSVNGDRSYRDMVRLSLDRCAKSNFHHINRYVHGAGETIIMPHLRFEVCVTMNLDSIRDPDAVALAFLPSKNLPSWRENSAD